MKNLIEGLTYRVVALAMTALHRTGFCSKVLLLPGFERLRWRLGSIGAWVRCHSTVRAVPAYRDFLAQRNVVAPAAIGDLTGVPPTDKATYVQAYSIDARCAGGRLPTSGITVDESSGSSGTPTNWVRGTRERAANGTVIRLGLESRLGKGPHFFINAFALGPWATGINLTLSLSSWCRVKSVGPDIAKIENTLRQFGPGHRYVILGYPPFLKQLVDSIAIDWHAYQVSMIFGGEGMSESMRRYLEQRGIRGVWGSYGASDLELNIAAETDLTIALRRMIEKRPALAARLLPQGGAMPMIFQFNPADFFIETTSDGELLVTVCRPDHVTPKVRYNIHDVGRVIRFPELAAALAAEGLAPADLSRRPLDLPLLLLYGRSDSAVAYYGCKIPPADVQEALFRVPALAADVDAFQIETFDDDAGDKRLVVHVELGERRSSEAPGSAHFGAGHKAPGQAALAGAVFDALAEVNQDFRESRRMVPAAKQPTVAFHAAGTGPFQGADIRVKRAYVRATEAGGGHRRRTAGIVNGRKRFTPSRQGAPT